MEHWPETVTDFYSILHVAPADVPPADAAHLIAALLDRPDSRLQAKVAGWSRPISLEEMRLLDLIDYYRKRHFKMFSPTPRPWDKAKRTYGGRNKRAFTRDEIRAAFSTPMA